MNILGAQRIITSDFTKHGYYAEDYSGDHLSNIIFNGRGKVLNVVNKYKCHEDSVNKNDFNNNKTIWADGEYYNCISITGKNIRYHKSETGGNSVLIESYDNGVPLRFKIFHMADIYVKAGDIIDSTVIIGTQGNTGLVLSKKPRTNPTYGTHVHFQVEDLKGNYINPRKYALGSITTTYLEQSNKVDTTKNQFKVLVPKINIRESSSVASKDLGYVYKGEVYTILDIVEDNQYIWYKITTNTGLNGFVANEKGYNWLEIIPVSVNLVVPPITEMEIENNVIEEKEEGNTIEKTKTENTTNNIISEIEEITTYNHTLIFECIKTDIYAIKLNEGEKLYISK
ncbi:MAG: M23 family metallopeptidase [Bacilli bacterium]|nr:M23 family metallopeptidase [Bacilli bacterium]